MQRRCTKVDPEVGPDDHENSKDDDGDIVQSHVVEGFRKAEPGIGNIHAHKDGSTNHGEVDEIGPTDQPKRDQMMRNELVVILPWLFQPQQHDQRLLEPEGKLKKVVKFELAPHLPMRILEPKMLEIKPPAILETHDVQSQRSSASPVQNCITLFREPSLFSLAFDPPPFCKGLEDVQRRRLSQEREDDDVEHEEEQVVVAFLVSSFEALC